MPTDAADLVLRPASPDDLPAVAALHWAARRHAVPAMPAPVHPHAEVLAHLGSLDLARHEVWLAEDASGLLGYATLTGAWLDDLYVAPEHQGRGVGSALLALVQGLRPDGFELWVFESNAPARALYARHGVIELETTDGSGNEEGAPDVRAAWPGADPLAFLRARIDDVDLALGDLLARRAALTAAVQPHKRTPGRDPAREAACAARVAARVPALAPEGVARILDAVITESLAAASETVGGP
ncbi:GNAT family N-acetyltransferase [Nocardioides sp. TRM66260-LWL]|uniref:GNAT family N-acetyltransferase n=1 Tax=Nocardioides sp. TRM66260-LWL TaxID=2874478 RepID=UPI001CC5F684|nr:GNAT family N-acetyltransferase [Nocardioides sp. TRM66260-LWL]MBZ5733360.1 GNAT family N-acetyltransferase [Nocardioides sp. TRM66260-LWL]